MSIVPQLANVAWAQDRELHIVPLQGVGVRRYVGLVERRHHARANFTSVVKSYFAKEEGGAPGATVSGATVRSRPWLTTQ
ncbi:Uncharacterised protein [Mycobacteroides abscessus subsp. abscessus]|nr:Uncharacterised protein [Mycobacteroides abscessus subsp. abscessus]